MFSTLLAMAPFQKAMLLGFGLVLGNILLAWIGAIVIGGFKIGSLERKVRHEISHADYAAFWERMARRLVQLGFRALPATGVFRQGGAEFMDMTTFTHARTKKEFRATPMDNGTGITIELSLRYLDPIVGDTGESAYRDSVLDFVAGITDTMQVVPNRSHGAFSALMGGILACAALLGFYLTGFLPVLPPILMVTGADVVVAIMAIVAIRSKPKELTGLWLAIIGIVLSVVATGGAIALELMTRI